MSSSVSVLGSTSFPVVVVTSLHFVFISSALRNKCFFKLKSLVLDLFCKRTLLALRKGKKKEFEDFLSLKKNLNRLLMVLT